MAVKVTGELTGAAVEVGVLRTRAVLMVQVKVTETGGFTPSVTEAVMGKAPPVVGMPEMRPVVGLREKLGGRGVEEKVRESLSASVAASWRLVVRPATEVRGPGLVREGGTLGVQGERWGESMTVMALAPGGCQATARLSPPMPSFWRASM